MTKYTVQSRQSLFDIAVERYGNVSGINWLLQDNPDLKGPTDRIYPGQQLLIRDQVVNNRVKFYLQGYPTVATITKDDLPEGVGFWRLDEVEIG